MFKLFCFFRRSWKQFTFFERARKANDVHLCGWSRVGWEWVRSLSSLCLLWWREHYALENSGGSRRLIFRFGRFLFDLNSIEIFIFIIFFFDFFVCLVFVLFFHFFHDSCFSHLFGVIFEQMFELIWLKNIVVVWIHFVCLFDFLWIHVAFLKHFIVLSFFLCWKFFCFWSRLNLLNWNVFQNSESELDVAKEWIRLQVIFITGKEPQIPTESEKKNQVEKEKFLAQARIDRERKKKEDLEENPLISSKFPRPWECSSEMNGKEKKGDEGSVQEIEKNPSMVHFANEVPDPEEGKRDAAEEGSLCVEKDLMFRGFDQWLHQPDVNWEKFITALTSRSLKDVWTNYKPPCVGVLLDSFELTRRLVSFLFFMIFFNGMFCRFRKEKFEDFCYTIIWIFFSSLVND